MTKKCLQSYNQYTIISSNMTLIILTEIIAFKIKASTGIWL